MVVDHLQNARVYESLQAAFVRAFEFLRTLRAEHFTEGRRELDGNRLYALAVVGDGKPRENVPLERHRRYIDIQYVVGGTDTMEWRSAHDCSTVSRPYDEATDAILWSDWPNLWVDVPPGHFAIFWPHDAHAPMCGSERIHKVVVKIL